MSQSPKYKGVSLDDMTPAQIDAAIVEMLTEMTPEQLDRAKAEIGRIIARRAQPK